MREESRSSSDRNRNSMDRDRSRFRVRVLRGGEGRRERRLGTGDFRSVGGTMEHLETLSFLGNEGEIEGAKCKIVRLYFSYIFGNSGNSTHFRHVSEFRI